MSLLYAKDNKLYANTYLEIYVPWDYFDNRPVFAVDQGVSIETFGLLFIRGTSGGKEGKIQLFSVPSMITLNIYDSAPEDIVLQGRQVKVITCRYMKDACVMNQHILQGREQAEWFLHLVLAGKLPRVLTYPKLIDVWWHNLEIANVNFKVPSIIYELILATIYRHPNNAKQRFGQWYGRQEKPDGHGYKTGKVEDIVADLSTFSGIIFQDMNKMITSGINNTLEGIEEPISPLERIISY